MKESLLFFAKMKPPRANEAEVDRLVNNGLMTDAEWLTMKAQNSRKIMDAQITDADVLRFLQGVVEEPEEDTTYQPDDLLEEKKRLTVSGSAEMFRGSPGEGHHEPEHRPRPEPIEGPLFFGKNGRFRLQPKIARELIGVKMVIAMIRALGLEKVQDTMVGDDVEIRGISGGQKKRMAIARVLVSNPYLIFLDEPTSGLSAADAVTLMREVKTLVDDLGIVAVL